MTNLVVSPNRIAREIDSFFNDFFNFPVKTDGQADFIPRVDISEDDDKIVMEFEVPGMKKDDLKIVVENNVLTVSGERNSKKETKKKNYVRTEMNSGYFCRSFTLPDSVDTEKIDAEYKNGILELKMNKREEAKPKAIEVKVS
ncbi:MAG: Hsp20/alpha crystallin family protein [FCB group bacterium]|nr:Hsp20/alpha crystallin family protein [FCB group bacterium]